MKMMQIQYLALFLLGSFSLAAASNGMRGAAARSQLQHLPPAFPIAGAPAAAGKAKLPTLDSTTVTWKVDNLNYYDLTKQWKDPFAGGAKKMSDSEMNDAQTKRKKAKTSGKKAPLGPEGLGEGVKHIDKGLGAIGGGLKDLGKDIDKGMKNTDKGIADAAKGKTAKKGADHIKKTTSGGASADKKSASKDGADGLLGDLGKMPWPTKFSSAVNVWRQRHHQMSMLHTKRGRHSLAQHAAQQLSALGPMTVQKALRTTLEGAIKDILACDVSQGPMPSPAPAPAPAPGPAKSIIPDGLRPTAAPVSLSVSRLRPRAPSPASAPTPASAPGPSPMSVCPKPKVHVALLPGGKMKNKHRGHLLNAHGKKQVAFSFRLANINYDKVHNNPTLKAAVRTAVQEGVVYGLPSGFDTSHVSVTLSSGSVVATITVTPGTVVARGNERISWTAEDLARKMRLKTRQRPMKSRVLSNVKAVPSLKGALAAGKTLNDITVTACSEVAKYCPKVVENRSRGRLLNAPAGPTPQSISIAVTVYDRPGNGMNDLHYAATELKKALLSGELMERIRSAIYAVTGVVPKVSGLRVKAKVIEQWDIIKCETHMTELIKSFTVHYTRRQVPMALYNECTNFMTKISFSHDYVLDKRDAARCRAATRKFARKWKSGKNNNPADFAGMCGNFCEAKYGNDAPQCRMANPAQASKLWMEITPPVA